MKAKTLNFGAGIEAGTLFPKVEPTKCKLEWYRKCSFNPQDCERKDCVYHKNHVRVS